MRNQQGISVIGVIILLFILVVMYINYQEDTEDTSRFPVSNASYDVLNSSIGCKSKLSNSKKDDVFNHRYRNHWMTWSGTIDLADSDDASINIDGEGAQDLIVDFEDKQAGYNLQKGDRVSVRFVMKTPGGCFLPFSGAHGEVLSVAR